MTWKPLPGQNDARRAIEGVEKSFSALRSFNLAMLVEDQGYPTDDLLDEAIRVTDWALKTGGITKRTHDLRVAAIERRRHEG